MFEEVSKFISEEKIKEIRENCSIIEVISDYVSLKKIGVNYRGLCPFHNEKTPSFFVNDERKFFNCFGCGTRGDVFTFLMKQENLSFQETAKLLAKRAGVSLPEKTLTLQEQKRLSERQECLSVNETAAKFYNNLLLEDKRGEEAKNYLIKRGITLDTIQEYCLGFAPEGWDAVVKHFMSRKISLLCAKKTGLIISKGGTQYYDRFRKRIIFPIYNVSGYVIGFGGRVIDNGEPKYLNSPESFIYSKRQNLYGLNVASKHIQKENRAIIVEGYFDLLILHQAGIKNAVAPLGTALTEQHIQTLKRYTSNIITVFDSDPSGEKAMIRSLEPFLKNSISPRLVVLPTGEDPDSFVRKQGQNAFRELIERAGFLLDFVIEKIIQKNQIAAPRGKIEACEEIVPLLKMVSDEMEKDLYIQKVSQKLEVKEGHIRSKMKVDRKQNSFDNTTNQPVQTSSTATKSSEKMILTILIYHPETIDIIEKESLLEEFTDPELKEAGKLLCKKNKQHGLQSLPYVMETVEKESIKEIVAELSFNDYSQKDPLKTLEDCIRDIRLRKSSLERKKVKILLEGAESVHDDSLSLKYQMEYQNLLLEEKKIKQYRLNFYQT
jgi:DNA primase